MKMERSAGVPGFPAQPGDPGDPDHGFIYDISFKFSGHNTTLRGGSKQGLTPVLGVANELADDSSLTFYLAEYFYEVDTPSGTFQTHEGCLVGGIVDRVPPSQPAINDPNYYPCMNLDKIKLFDGNQEVGCLVTGEM